MLSSCSRPGRCSDTRPSSQPHPHPHTVLHLLQTSSWTWSVLNDNLAKKPHSECREISTNSEQTEDRTSHGVGDKVQDLSPEVKHRILAKLSPTPNRPAPILLSSQGGVQALAKMISGGKSFSPHFQSPQWTLPLLFGQCPPLKSYHLLPPPPNSYLSSPTHSSLPPAPVLPPTTHSLPPPRPSHGSTPLSTLSSAEQSPTFSLLCADPYPISCMAHQVLAKLSPWS